MKLPIILKRFALAATALVAVALAARAADKPAPLKLQSDAKAINRDANQRVSYSAVVKKTAPSVVYVFSSKKVRGQDFSQFFGDPSFRRFSASLASEAGASRNNASRAWARASLSAAMDTSSPTTTWWTAPMM
jgi:S1-C subfamily serine protease